MEYQVAPKVFINETGEREYQVSPGVYLLETVATSSGINLQINIGDVWKVVAGAQINIGDTWKTVVGIQINIGDVWKTVF
jgi:hypothetical protein